MRVLSLDSFNFDKAVEFDEVLVFLFIISKDHLPLWKVIGLILVMHIHSPKEVGMRFENFKRLEVGIR